jgi:glutamine amidotransferase
MGWNDAIIIKNNPLFKDLDASPLFYFLHSYYFFCRNQDDILAQSEYGERFTCAINHENIYGVQFHPEKSHNNGIQLLKNFATI